MASEIEHVSCTNLDNFHSEILAKGKPVVIRGLVNHWPIVAAGKAGSQTFCNYLKKFDKNYDLSTVYGPPSINGRIFYNSDMSGLNCRMGQTKLSNALDYLLEHETDDPAPLLAMQSIQINRFLPGLQHENRLSLLSDAIEPRIWIGGRTTVAAHYDPSENIACCVAGKRRFTLFPPEQIANLYIGPFELTPAGAAISMVDINQPDYEKYPRFRAAEATALYAELEPGDAIYIPYLWWHHVSSLEGINALVNYWWGNTDELQGEPRNALLHAMMSIRSLPPHHRNAWHAMFEHYVFERNGNPGAHLPVERRGILSEMKSEALKKVRTAIVKALSRF